MTEISTMQVRGIEKVNTLRVSHGHASVGGFSSDGKGLVVMLPLSALDSEETGGND